MITRIQFFSFVAFLFLVSPTAASAATISLQATPTRIGAGDVVRVSVLLDSAIPTNAFSGTLQYPAALLEPVAINDGSSIISLWIMHPTVPVTGEPIAFAGITPGGFSGNAGMLFSVLFRAKAAGTAEVSLAGSEVLRNDGVGGIEPVTVHPLALAIGSKSSGGYVETPDLVPPESFTAYLGDDPQLFDGRKYLVFMAVDKISGIDHYMLAESRVPSFLHSFFPPSWQRTISPYAMADQNLTSTVYLKAVDRAGNERVTIFPLSHLVTVYEMLSLLGILLIVVFLWQKGQGRRRRKNL
ncbi:MAG: cohesin domain-containing protein [Candidatus Kaiserbacteria bacterium]|nr:cohesin domain-containing protein [Candidatus Kaiserbacteria bacterium]